MKIKVKYFLAALLFVSVSSFAQTGKYSVGIVTTQFVNANSQNKISELNNPNSFGIILGVKINKDVFLAITTEYFDGNIQNGKIKEKNYRAHASLYFKPIASGRFSPYFSAGLVAAHRKQSGSVEKNETQFFGRFGFGIDFNLIDRLFLNTDMGFYSNGLNYSGVSTSVGLRFAL